MTLSTFREAYQRDAANVTFGEIYTSNSLAAGAPTPWFNLTPRNGKANVLGAWFTAIYVLTATGAATPVAGSDALSPILDNGGRIDVGQSPGAAGRSQNLTRQFVEFNEAVTTNINFSIAALPTFTSASTSTVTVQWFVPVGGTAGAIRITLPGAITGSYASGVTVSYTSIESEILSTNYTGVCAFREEKTASLGGSTLTSVLTYLPKDIAPDMAFMQGESSTTITQVLIIALDGTTVVNSANTGVLQTAAAAAANVSGTTYTTSNGFVLSLNQKQFQSWQMLFSSATTHYVGFIQVAGGEEVLPNLQAAPTQATPAVTQVGSVTPSGQVAAGPGGAPANPGGKGGGLLGGVAPRVSPPNGGRMVYRRRT